MQYLGTAGGMYGFRQPRRAISKGLRHIPPAPPSHDEPESPFALAVASVLDGLAAGDVVTYGEVASEAGFPGRARAVGTFLATHGSGYPWWRVVTVTGRLVPGNEAEHERRLRAEGVAVVGGRVRPPR